MNNPVQTIKARLAQIEEELKPGGILLGGQKEVIIRELTQSLGASVEILELISRTDISESGPTLQWLMDWRHSRKDFAANSLSKIAKIMVEEGK